MYGSLPHSPQVEKEVLGAVLVNPDAVKVLVDLGVKPEHFYFERHQRLCAAILTLALSGIPADLVTIEGELRRVGSWDRAGGYNTLANCMDKGGLSSSVDHYCRILIREAARRHLIIIASDAAEEVRKSGGDDALEKAQVALRGLDELTIESIGTDAKAGVQQHIEYVKAVQEGRITDTRLPTGLSSLDDHLGGGLKTGWQVVVMSAAGHGKTALSVNNLALAAAKKGHPVLICSLEMKPTEIYARLMAAECGVPVHVHDRPGMDPYDMSRLIDAANLVHALPISVIDSRHGSIPEIRRAAQRMKAQHGRVGMVVVDYIQLMKSGSGKRESTTEEDIASNSKGLKHMAVELDCVTVLLSQPTLASKRDKKRPSVSHSKGSGSIEDDCDLALVPWLPHKVSDSASRSDAEIGMDKFRHGPQRSLTSKEIRWNGRYMRFEEI
jgi:replicative DNA helicase